MDPKTLEVYNRLYSQLAQHLDGRLAFLYAGISGDFGEYCYPSGIKHYLFSPAHNHAASGVATAWPANRWRGACARNTKICNTLAKGVIPAKAGIHYKTTPAEGGFQPFCLIWLKCYESLNELNRAWHTHFASWQDDPV